MKNILTGILTVSLLLVCVFSIYAVGEDKSITGILNVVKDKEGNIKIAIIEVEEVNNENKKNIRNYNLILSQKGRELARLAESRKVTVTGTIRIKGSIHSILVKSYEIVSENR